MGRYGQQGGKPLSKEQVRTLVKNYVKNTGNPNPQVGEITRAPDKNAYVATIMTKDGSPEDKILVNEYTDWLRFAN